MLWLLKRLVDGSTERYKNKMEKQEKLKKIGLRGARGRRLGCSVVEGLAQRLEGPDTSTARYSESSNNHDMRNGKIRIEEEEINNLLGIIHL